MFNPFMDITFNYLFNHQGYFNLVKNGDSVVDLNAVNGTAARRFVKLAVAFNADYQYIYLRKTLPNNKTPSWNSP